MRRRVKMESLYNIEFNLGVISYIHNQTVILKERLGVISSLPR
jgi:hypothetical protein